MPIYVLLFLFNFSCCFTSLVLLSLFSLVLVDVGYIYACIDGAIRTDEATAKRAKCWNFS